MVITSITERTLSLVQKFHETKRNAFINASYTPFIPDKNRLITRNMIFAVTREARLDFLVLVYSALGHKPHKSRLASELGASRFDQKLVGLVLSLKLQTKTGYNKQVSKLKPTDWFFCDVL